MTFPVTQLGRFGGLCRELVIGADTSVSHTLDVAAALAIAADAMFARPMLAEVLGWRGLVLPGDPEWLRWTGQRFPEIVSSFHLSILAQYAPCPREVPSVPRDCCPHALTPPRDFAALRGDFFKSVPDNVKWRSDGSGEILGYVEPSHLFVILEDGEILVGLEHEKWFKHPSLSGGRPVWSAGEFGSEQGTLCVANLASGHYVGRRQVPEEQFFREALTERIFKEYCDHFKVSIHESFRVSSWRS